MSTKITKIGITSNKISGRGGFLYFRSIKELATKEQLSFKSFGMNKAYYFMLVFTHFIFEAYKQDVTVFIFIFILLCYIFILLHETSHDQ